MVAQQVINDVHVLREDIERARSAGGGKPEDYGRWLLILGYIAARLEGRLCMECGQQMQYNATLEAHVCSHDEPVDSD